MALHPCELKDKKEPGVGDPIQKEKNMSLELRYWAVKLAFIVVSIIVLISVFWIAPRYYCSSYNRRLNDPHAPDRFVTTSVPLYDKNGHALDPSGIFYVVTDRYLGKQYVVFTVSTSATTLSNIDCTSE
jgi:hypothetical protein